MFDPEKDAQARQLLKEYRRLIAFLEANATELKASGVDVQPMLAQTKADLAKLEGICSEADSAEESFLQATADLADKEREVFKEASKLVDHLLEQNPSDPRVQKLLRQREQLKKQFPRE
jgi:hypothetical protein